MKKINIKYDILGHIIEGNNSGWDVKFIDDRKNTGGFYIYEFKDSNGDEGFDTWLETESDVQGFIRENEWKIEWYSKV